MDFVKIRRNPGKGWSENMPLVAISMRKGRSRALKQNIMEAVHSSLVEWFKIPAWDFNQRIHEFEEENFHIPEGKSGDYTIIEMTVFSGRSLDAKRSLYQAIVKKLEALGLPVQDVILVLNEPGLDNWGIRGGIPASELDIGFKLDV
jgi:phenylpyruvate tautomerase PptA (4-oxalocrotonate tautomerase family)